MYYHMEGFEEHGIKSPGEKYQDMIRKVSQVYGLPEILISHQIYRESGFNPTAVSAAGAVGMMQLLPETAALVAKRTGTPFLKPLTDPEQNIVLGAALMRDLFDQAYKAVGDVERAYRLALVGYYGGPGRMAAVINGGEMTPAESIYVDSVIWDFDRTESWADVKIKTGGKGSGLLAWLFTFPGLLLLAAGYYVYEKKGK